MNIFQVKKSFGFTLIELMVTLAVAAIVMTIGVPSFKDYITNQRARTVAQDLVVILTYARSEAIKRNTKILLSIKKEGDFLKGWSVSTGDTKDYEACSTSTMPSECLRIQSVTGDINLTDGATSIVFQPTGRLTQSISTPFTICVPKAVQRQIRVDSTGFPVISKTSTVCS